MKNDLEYSEKLELFIQNIQTKLDKTTDELEINRNILFQNSKMAIMGEMIDSIAHQWTQPLNVILLKSEYLSCLTDDNDMIDKKYLDKVQNDIKGQVYHLNTTIQEFRNFLRPNYNIKKLNLKSVLESIEILLKDELIKYSIVLESKEVEEIFLWANENDIIHLLINLINNAKDEMVNSDIVKSNRIITIKCFKNKDNHIEILVKDNGRGIPKNILYNIFKPNFTTKKDKGGTGVGLYMCKQIVSKYNGQICVFNENGAIFKMTFLEKSSYNNDT